MLFYRYCYFFQILFCLLALAYSAKLPNPYGPGNFSFNRISSQTSSSRTRSSSSRISPFRVNNKKCGKDEILKSDGTCIKPEVLTKVFAFVAPKTKPRPIKKVEIPKPKVDHRVVFVKAPVRPEQPDPIIAPAPKSETNIYVLSKNEPLIRRVIEAPEQPLVEPKINYLAYEEGQNLPKVHGFDLQSIFSNAELGKVAYGFSQEDDDSDEYGDEDEDDDKNESGGRSEESSEELDDIFLPLDKFVYRP